MNRPIFKTLPHDREAHIITNIGMFKFCRNDRFCRCRKCKPPITKNGE